MINLSKIIKDISNPRKYVDVHSVEDYLKLPKANRTKYFGLWYLEPYALPIKAFNQGGKSTWEDFHIWTKANYPIQHYFREVFPKYFWPIKRKLSDLCWKIYRFFNPCNKELRAVIRREWTDISELIKDFLFQCVISYVENEHDGKLPIRDINEVDSTGHKMEEFEISMVNNWNIFYRDLQLCYNYIKIERLALQKQIDIELKNVFNRNEKLPYDEKYSDIIKLEAQIDQADKKWLQFIVINKDSFWS